MDNQNIIGIVKILPGLLKVIFKNLPPVGRNIGALILLLAFVGMLILSPSGCSLPAFLVVMPAIILMAIFIVWIAYRFDQQRKRDAQDIHIHEGIRRDLEELINVKSLKETLSIAKETIEKLTETVKTAEQKSQLEEKAAKLGNYLEILGSIAESFSIWKEAEIWLRNNQERLVKIAIGKFSARLSDLKNPGRSLDTEEKTKGFEESINRHVQWVLKLLSFGTDKIRFDESPVIPERYAYREIFEYLRNEVEKNEKPPLSSSAKKAIVGRLEILINKYSD